MVVGRCAPRLLCFCDIWGPRKRCKGCKRVQGWLSKCGKSWFMRGSGKGNMKRFLNFFVGELWTIEFYQIIHFVSSKKRNKLDFATHKRRFTVILQFYLVFLSILSKRYFLTAYNSHGWVKLDTIFLSVTKVAKKENYYLNKSSFFNEPCALLSYWAFLLTKVKLTIIHLGTNDTQRQRVKESNFYSLSLYPAIPHPFFFSSHPPSSGFSRSSFGHYRANANASVLCIVPRSRAKGNFLRPFQWKVKNI